MFEFSHSFYRFPEEVNTRLDVLYNDAIYDDVYAEMDSSPFNFIPLSKGVDFLKDSRNPLLTPDEEFYYAEIGNVDIVKGKLGAVKMLGSEATSSRTRRVMYKDNILVSTTRPTRKAIAKVPSSLDGEICSTGFAVLRSIPEILPDFLLFSLRSDVSKKQFERYCTGAGYPAINQEKDLPKVLIPLLDKNEQELILSQVKRIQYHALRYEVLAKRVFEKTKTYFKEEINIPYDYENEKNYFHKSGFEKEKLSFHVFPENMDNRLNYLTYNPRLSVIDQLKTEYSTIKLSDILTEPIKRGNQPLYDETGSRKVIKTVDVSDEGINLEQCLSVEDDFFERSRENYVVKGDILITSTGIGSIGKISIYNHDEPVLCDGHISIIRISDEYSASFVCHFLRSHYGQVQIESLFTGSSGQIELQPSDIGGIILPDSSDLGIPLSKQVEIAERMDDKLGLYFINRKQAEKKWIEADQRFEEYILGKIPLPY
ncbi:restriction endonuclease subunit S [Virgibacillus halodenitrificans]|uniref:Restriction endonuclease subunit S n=1 Tax=Virgibacillus halodenitrificans TaxID=1482 RepID=A0ABR7VRQ3_VIRHA|nr:hypothetical protein [Virgibacillus halodenitrificans]MBD1224031.1 hypothetical protein [Virgibacillus halodenitrificans]